MKTIKKRLAPNQSGSESIITDREDKNTKYSISLFFNQESSQTTIKVFDNISHEVINDIPAQKLLDINAEICDMAGLLFNKKRMIR